MPGYELEDIRVAADTLSDVLIFLTDQRYLTLTPTEKSDLRLALSAVENLTGDIREAIGNA